jgi:hypothetical protein
MRSPFDAQFLSLLEILREPGADERAAAQSYSALRAPARLPDLYGPCEVLPVPRGRRRQPDSGGSVVYLALLPRVDESTLKQVAYFWKSVGSLRAQFEFSASILFCPTKWKSELDVWAHVSGSMDLQRRVKNAFDPSGVFAPGRFVGGS